MAQNPRNTATPSKLIALLHQNHEAATKMLATFSVEDQVALICSAPVSERAALLFATPEVEKVVPALPEVDLCTIVKASGLDQAGWILSCANSEQLRSCLDLDAWHGFTPDNQQVAEWLEGFANAGDETLFRAAHAMDSEMLMLHLRSKIEVFLKPNNDDWQAPINTETLDGQFYFRPKDPNEAPGTIRRLLHLLFNQDYWTYFRMLQATIWGTAKC